MSGDHDVSTGAHLHGNTGGAVLLDGRVHRATGPWTPAVHALLTHLHGRTLRAIPQVHGLDEDGREVLDYLPGEVAGYDQAISDARLAELGRWARELHDRTRDFAHPGPWRFFGATAPTVIGHNDLSPDNTCWDGDRLAGVFDWDLAGPTTPLLELGWIAWQCAPLHRPLPPDWCAARVRLLAQAYGDADPAAILDATEERVELAIQGVLQAAAAGDAGMQHLIETTGEPEPMRRRLADLRSRLPAIRALLGQR